MASLGFFYAVEILVVAAVLMWFFARPWQAFCTDISRHRYFELRDRLFVIAAQGRVEFDDPVYQALRDWLNQRIRHAHVNIFGDLVAVVIAHKGEVPKAQTVGDEIEEMENDSLRTEMQSIYMQAIQIQIAHMVVRSPIFLVLTVLTPIIILIELISGRIRAIIRWLSDLAEIADDDIGKKYIAERG